MEGKSPAGTERLVLQQIVADASKVNAELDCMVTDNLGPVVDKVDVRFAPDPGHRRRIPNQWTGKTTIESHANLTGCERLSADVHARHAQSCRIVGAVVARLRIVAQMGDADTCFSKKRR